MRQVASILSVGLVAAGAGCAPRTTIAVGVAAVVTSAVMIATLEDTDCAGEELCGVSDLLQGGENVLVAILAGGIGLTGVGYIASGTAGLYEEKKLKGGKELKPTLLLPNPPAPPAALGPEPAGRLPGHPETDLHDLIR